MNVYNPTFQSVRNYLKDAGHQEMIDQYTLIGSLSDKMKRKLSDALYEYIKKTFPKEPSTETIIDVCQAAVSIFPLIKVDPSDIGGIVSFSNVSTFKSFRF